MTIIVIHNLGGLRGVAETDVLDDDVISTMKTLILMMSVTLTLLYLWLYLLLLKPDNDNTQYTCCVFYITIKF